MSVYLAAGAILAVGAWVQIGRTNAASPNAGIDLNLDSITAVVIGGTSLFGGRGVVGARLLGALIVGVFRSGLSLAGLDVLYQTLAVGVLIIVAVSVDQWIRKVRNVKADSTADHGTIPILEAALPRQDLRPRRRSRRRQPAALRG